ncbi:MAG TPA: universal stress protein [Methylophilaceae bacterium]
MTGFDKVLLATDFSERSENAMQRVMLLAAAGIREIRLLHVLSGTLLDDLKHLVAGGVSARLREAMQQKLQEQAGRLQVKVNAAVEYSLEVGRPHVVIIEQGRQTDSLIVVGAHSRSVHDWVRGSMLERMLGAGRQPMLVVRKPALEPYRRVLVPVDFSDCSAAAVEAAARLAPEAEIMLLHVHALPFESKLRIAGVTEADMREYQEASRQQAERELADFLQRLDLRGDRVTSRLEYGHAPEVILETVDRERCDLVVMGRYGKSGPSEILLGSVTEYVATVSDCDLMVVSL